MSSPTPLICAVDPGTIRLGYALYDPAAGAMVDSGWRGFTGPNVISRLHSVRDIVDNLIQPDKEIALVAVERMWSARNGADFSLHVVSFMVQERAWLLGIKCVEIAPMTAKKAATGSGKATKREVVVAMRMQFGGAPTEDQADAMAIALAGASLL